LWAIIALLFFICVRACAARAGARPCHQDGLDGFARYNRGMIRLTVFACLLSLFLPSGGIFFIRAIESSGVVHRSVRREKSAGPKNARKCSTGSAFNRFAYDWRAEHIPTFETEIDTCRKHNIEINRLVVPNHARQRRANNSRAPGTQKLEAGLMGDGWRGTDQIA